MNILDKHSNMLKDNISNDSKYISCYELYSYYNTNNNIEKAIYYLIESEKYNTGAIYNIKCMKLLIDYYFNKGDYEIVELYFRGLEQYYMNGKMEDCIDAYFVIPYYMAIVCDRTKNRQLAINAYKYSFIKEYKNVNQQMIGNYLYNLQFYIEHVDKTDTNFFSLANIFINNLETNGYNVSQYNFIDKYKIYGIEIDKNKHINFSEEDCKQSKNILIYTGWMTNKWNYTYSLSNSLGGSETAAAYLANMLPKDYKIYVAGLVEEESYDNIEYINEDKLQQLIKEVPFYTIIVSRYVDFYERYSNFSAYKTYIWGHDIYLFSSLETVDNIINKWSKKINGVICQTEWHKNQLLSVHNSLNNIKLYIINNGIDINLINNATKHITNKVKNRFIYSSCSERGLERLVQLWPEILKSLPDAELFIASYNKFPSSELDYLIKNQIDKYQSVTHVGKLTKTELYELMATTEYWLYPTCFDETSCITAMELLANGVICLYYPRAGLVNTVGEYGIKISPGSEIDTLLSLTDDQKEQYNKNGTKYAKEICSWENRIKQWNEIIFDKDLIDIINNQYISSKNILIYTGIFRSGWNYSYSLKTPIGGAETAAIELAHSFSKDYNIYISGTVDEEQYDNIRFINEIKLQELINTIDFKLIIVSRDIGFFEKFKNIKSYKNVIWAHDYHLCAYGSNLSLDAILNKWRNKISEIICQTEWHKETLLNNHPFLKSYTINIINNGIDSTKLNYDTTNKIKDSFIYSSCTERGLERLLELWPQIISNKPDAVLYIAGYNIFPKSEYDLHLKSIMDKYENIKYVGRLIRSELYKLMSQIEYWLYPSSHPETSCLSAMELLASEVICLYYPIGGLNNTLGQYGIKLEKDKEIDILMSLTNDQKNKYRKEGKEYALNTCCWSNRIKEWNNIINKESKWVFIIPNWFSELNLFDYFDSLKYKYNLVYFKETNSTDDIEYLKKYNIYEVTFVYGCFNNSLLEYINKNNITISILNTEPLNINFVRNRFITCIKEFNIENIKVYDYSKSNIKILNSSNINNTEHLPYNINNIETNYLKELNVNTFKKYDFGYIYGGEEKRRTNIIDNISNKYNVKIINGWKEDRDKQLAECKVILNIHGFGSGQQSNIFEHLRCDRLLEAGFTILSEESYELDKEFQDKYPNLHIIKYDDFFDNDILNNVISNNNIKNICFIHSCTINGNTNRLEYLINKIKISGLINILDSIIINNIGDSIETIFKDVGNKIIINNYSKDINLNEIPTINMIKSYCNTNNCNILYIHTKGVSHGNNIKINNWIDMMLYFLVDRYNECINNICNGYECVGCNYHDGIISNYPKHFSGNFWWASSKYIETLDYLKEDANRIEAEFWLCKNNPKVYVMHNSNINHYLEEYPKYKYEISNLRKIVDCFTFYNELDLLEYRLNVLNDVVDYFVIVEANQTFVGKQKELYFNNNKQRFDKFKDKIIHIIVDLPYIGNINVYNNEQWVNERHQRNCIAIGIDKIKLNENDLIIIADLDEIPDPKLLQYYKQTNKELHINRLEQDFYYYNLNNRHYNKWYLSKILSYNSYKILSTNCDNIRNFNCPNLERGGWHLSYFGSAEFIKNKIEQFSHQEYNNERYTNIKSIEYKINNNIDLYDRENDKTEYVSVKNNTYLPPLYDSFLTKFYKD